MHPIVPHPAPTGGWLHLRWGHRSLSARTGPLPEVETRAWFVSALNAALAGQSSVLDLASGVRLELQPAGPWGLRLRWDARPTDALAAPALAVDWATTWRAWMGTPPPRLVKVDRDAPALGAPHIPDDPSAWLQFFAIARGTRIRWGSDRLTVSAPPRAVLAGWLQVCRSILGAEGVPGAGLSPSSRVAAHQPALWRIRATAGGWSLCLLDAEGTPLGVDFKGDSQAWQQLLHGCGALRIGSACTRAEVRRLIGGSQPRLTPRRPGTRRCLGLAESGVRKGSRARPRVKFTVGLILGADRDLFRVRWRLRWVRTLRSGRAVQRWGAVIVMGAADTVWRLDAHTGATVWSHRGVRLLAVPEVVDRSRGGLVRLDRRTGERRWAIQLDAAGPLERSGPWLWQGLGPAQRCIRLSDGELVATAPGLDHRRQLGRRRWHHEGHRILGIDPGNRFNPIVWSAPGPLLGALWLGHGRLLYRMSADVGPVLVGCSTRTGHTWRRPFEGPEPTQVLATHHAELGPTLLLWAPEPGGWWLSAVHAPSGSLRWRHRATHGAEPDLEVCLAADGQVVVVKSEAGAVRAIDLSTGAVRWQLRAVAGEPPPAHNVPPLAWRGLWLVAREAVVALRPLDGQVVGTLDLEGLRPDHLSALADGGLLVAEAGEARVYDLAGHLAMLPGGKHGHRHF